VSIPSPGEVVPAPECGWGVFKRDLLDEQTLAHHYHWLYIASSGTASLLRWTDKNGKFAKRLLCPVAGCGFRGKSQYKVAEHLVSDWHCPDEFRARWLHCGCGKTVKRRDQIGKHLKDEGEKAELGCRRTHAEWKASKKSLKQWAEELGRSKGAPASTA